MRRKVCRISAGTGTSRPLINRKKNVAFVNKPSTSNNRQIVATAVTKLFKKNSRRKISQGNYKCKQVSRNNCVTSGSGSSIPSKVDRKNCGVSVDNKKLENEISRDFDCCTDGIKMIAENASASDPAVEDIQSTTTLNDFPKSWTEEMIRYYFEPNEKRKNFDYVEVMNNIEYKASDWWISDADRIGCRKKREFFLRCAKCNQKGHTKKDCKKHVVCYVCGEFNHWYSDCPNALCFTCGRATKTYSNNCRQCRKILNSRKKCTLCGQIWHEERLCPSKWRKYLMITRSTREPTIRLNSKKCCYNCAQRGHFGFECPLVLDSDYPPENPLKTVFPAEQLCSGNGCGDDNGNDNRNHERDCEKTVHSGDIGNSNGNNNLGRFHVYVIFLATQTSDVLSSEMGKRFLMNLSHNTNVRIELFRGKQSYIKLFGDDEIVNHCKSELLKWKIPK